MIYSKPSEKQNLCYGRRRFIIAGAAGLFLPSSVLGATFWDLPRLLHLRRASTGEVVKETYWANGKVVEPGYKKVCHLLRDVTANESIAMSLGLLDVLTGIQGWFRAYGQERLLIITSGYRSVRTNSATEGAAKNSLHTQGRAADITIPGVPVTYLANLGVYLRGGGVGWYPSRNFTHVDDGRIRTWKG